MKAYLTPAGTLHSFRSGCTITFVLTGMDLAQSMGHVDWRRQSTASYYMQLSNVMSANSLSVTLTGPEVNIVAPGDLYQNCNTLRNFLPAIPRENLSSENGRLDLLGLSQFFC